MGYLGVDVAKESLEVAYAAGSRRGPFRTRGQELTPCSIGCLGTSPMGICNR